jgi:hypothetical protein
METLGPSATPSDTSSLPILLCIIALKAMIAEPEKAVVRQRFRKNVTAETDTRNNRETVGGSVPCWVRVLGIHLT